MLKVHLLHLIFNIIIISNYTMIQVTFIFLIPYTTLTVEFPLPAPIEGQFHLAISLFPHAFARIQTNLILAGMEITYNGQLGRQLEAGDEGID
jgi:hypothetical protein